MTSPSPTTPQTTPNPPTYQDRAVVLARQAIAAICQSVPELRSAVLIFDWRERLAEVSVPAVFWTGAGPPDGEDPLYIAALLSQLARVMQMESTLAYNCLTELDKLLKDGREKMIHESRLDPEEKATLLQALGRECAPAPGASSPRPAK